MELLIGRTGRNYDSKAIEFGFNTVVLVRT